MATPFAYSLGNPWLRLHLVGGAGDEEFEGEDAVMQVGLSILKSGEDDRNALEDWCANGRGDVDIGLSSISRECAARGRLQAICPRAPNPAHDSAGAVRTRPGAGASRSSRASFWRILGARAPRRWPGVDEVYVLAHLPILAVEP